MNTIVVSRSNPATTSRILPPIVATADVTEVDAPCGLDLHALLVHRSDGRDRIVRSDPARLELRARRRRERLDLVLPPMSRGIRLERDACLREWSAALPLPRCAARLARRSKNAASSGGNTISVCSRWRSSQPIGAPCTEVRPTSAPARRLEGSRSSPVAASSGSPAAGESAREARDPGAATDRRRADRGGLERRRRRRTSSSARPRAHSRRPRRVCRRACEERPRPSSLARGPGVSRRRARRDRRSRCCRKPSSLRSHSCQSGSSPFADRAPARNVGSRALRRAPGSGPERAGERVPLPCRARRSSGQLASRRSARDVPAEVGAASGRDRRRWRGA